MPCTQRSFSGFVAGSCRKHPAQKWPTWSRACQSRPSARRTSPVCSSPWGRRVVHSAATKFETSPAASHLSCRRSVLVGASGGGRLQQPRQVRRRDNRGALCSDLHSEMQKSVRPPDFVWRAITRGSPSDSAGCPPAATHSAELSRYADPVSAYQTFVDAAASSNAERAYQDSAHRAAAAASVGPGFNRYRYDSIFAGHA